MTNLTLSDLYNNTNNEKKNSISVEEYHESVTSLKKLNRYFGILDRDMVSLESIIRLCENKNTGLESETTRTLASAVLNTITSKYDFHISMESDSDSKFNFDIVKKAKYALKKLLEIMSNAFNKVKKFLSSSLIKLLLWLASESNQLINVFRQMKIAVGTSITGPKESHVATHRLNVEIDPKLKQKGSVTDTYLAWLNNVFSFFRNTSPIVKDLVDLWGSNVYFGGENTDKERKLMTEYHDERAKLSAVELYDDNKQEYYFNMGIKIDSRYTVDSIDSGRISVIKEIDRVIDDLKPLRTLEVYKSTRLLELGNYEWLRKNASGVETGYEQNSFIREHTRRIRYVFFMYELIHEYTDYVIKAANFFGTNVITCYNLIPAHQRYY